MVVASLSYHESYDDFCPPVQFGGAVEMDILTTGHFRYNPPPATAGLLEVVGRGRREPNPRKRR